LQKAIELMEKYEVADNQLAERRRRYRS